LAINYFLQQDLNRLVKPSWDRSNPGLPDRLPSGAAEGGRGTANGPDITTPIQGVPDVKPFAERLNVWSELIITEDGAFEVPDGWPLNGDYPSSAVAPDPLPPSLKLVSSVLSLDTGVQYYLQKRVHMVYFTQDLTAQTKAFRQDDLYIPFAWPFLGLGYYQGVSGVGNQWVLGLKMSYVADLASGLSVDPAIQPKVNELAAMGVQVG
jgi:hypothetical protein